MVPGGGLGAGLDLLLDLVAPHLGAVAQAIACQQVELGAAGGGHGVIGMRERAALVGLEVREGDVAELLDRHHVRDRLANEREPAK